MRQAVAKCQPALGRADFVVLAQVRHGRSDEFIELDSAEFRHFEDHCGRGDDLRQRGKVEPVPPRQRLTLWLDRRKTVENHGTLARYSHHSQSSTRDRTAPDRLGRQRKRASGNLVDHAPNTLSGVTTRSSACLARMRTMTGISTIAAMDATALRMKNPS